jgi:hypothetical protein
MTLISLSEAEVNQEDFSHVLKYIQWNPAFTEYMQKRAGQEYFKLISSLVKAVGKHVAELNVVDVSSTYGAAALSFLNANYPDNLLPPKVKVTSYDTINMFPNNTSTVLNAPHVTRKIMSAQIDIHNIAKSDIVLLDMHPHNGTEESKVFSKLVQHGFKGVLVVDAINMNANMKSFWDNIPSNFKKIDATHLGHHTGTGIVVFDTDMYDVTIE